MYAIIEKCYGIILFDSAKCSETSKENLALLRKIVELNDSKYLRSDPEDPESLLMSDDEFAKEWVDVVDGAPYIFSSYSGDGENPQVLGVGIECIAAHDVEADFFQNTPEQALDALEKFKNNLHRSACNNVEEILSLLEGKMTWVYVNSTS